MISVGVVGAGYWGPNLVRNFWEINDTRVAMCCDMNPERLKFINKRYPSIKTTTSYDDLMNNPDINAIAVATHAASHYALTRKALEHGKHVFVEKPISMNGNEAKELHRIAEERGLILMVGHILLYSGAVETIKDMINNGELGSLYYLDSVRVNLQPFREDVNVLWDLAPHDISLAMYLIGEDPVSTSVVGQSYVSGDQENIAFGVLRFPNKAISHFHLSWLSPMKMRQTVIVGAKKMIVFDDVDAISKVKIFDKGVDIAPTPSGLTERQLICRKGDVYCPKIDEREPLMKEVFHFVDCIKNKKKPLSDGLNGYKVVKVVEAMQESMHNGGVEVKLDFSEIPVGA